MGGDLEKKSPFYLSREVPGANKKMISLRSLRLCGENSNLDTLTGGVIAELFEDGG